MKIFKKKYFYLNYGTIGDMIMVSSLLDVIHKKDRDAVFYVGVIKNFNLIKSLTSKYGWIRFFDLSKKQNFLILYLKIVFGKVFVIVPPSFGRVPKKISLFLKALSMFNFENSPIGFSINEETEKFLAKKIPFQKNKIFLDNLGLFLPVLGFKEEKIIPHFDFVFNEKFIESLGLKKNKYIVFHVCAANKVRSLPKSRWISVIKGLKGLSENNKFVFSAAKKDLDFVNEIIVKSGVSGIVADGSIHDIATLIRDAKLYVGIDTGITHMACVQKVDSVIIANNSNPTWLPSYNPNATILKNDEVCTCDGLKGGDCLVDFEGDKYYRCLFFISDEEIIFAIKEKLK